MSYILFLTLGRNKLTYIHGKNIYNKVNQKKNRWEDKLLGKASGKGKTGGGSCMTRVEMRDSWGLGTGLGG